MCRSCRTCFKFYCMFYFTCDRSFNCTVKPPSQLRQNLQEDLQDLHKSRSLHCTCTIVGGNLQLEANHSVPLIDGISPLSGISRLLTERVPDDRHHGRGAAQFLATLIAVVIQVCCKLLVACCNVQLASFNF